ncbi:MAG: S8 family serine peptidase [Pseudomonadota bacterium]
MLIWAKEPMFRPVPVDTIGDGDGPDGETLFDAYSQWKLGHGLSYDRDIQARFGALDDVTLLRKLSLDEEDTIIGTTPGRPLLKVSADALEEAVSSAPVASEATQSSNAFRGYSDIWVPLPIRSSGVAEKLADQTLPAYVAPEALDASKTVVIGIIDDAMNVAHENFTDDTGASRFDYLWVQDAATLPLGKNEAGSSFVAYGREVDHSDIEAAREKHGSNEEAIWRQLHMVETGDDYRRTSLQNRRSHGTHIADLAGGETAPDEQTVHRRLIGVQLPVLATQDTSGAALIAVVADAVRYIYQRALRISQALNTQVPVIINLSYGIAVGARDGKHMLDRLLEKYAQSYRKATEKLGAPSKEKCAAPAITVLPAGNGHLARGHASSQNGPLDLRLQIQPQDETSSYLEVWIPNDASSIQLDIAPPGMEAQTVVFDQLKLDAPVSMLDREAWLLKDDKSGRAVCRVTFDEPGEFLDQDSASLHWRVLVAIAPSASLQNRPTAPSGEWTICANAVDSSGGISAWIARDENLSGFPNLGRQPYFLDDAYENALFDERGDLAVDGTPSNLTIQRDKTVSGIGHTAGSSSPTAPVLVGANFQDNRHAAPYCAAGGRQNSAHTVNGAIISADSDCSRLLPGMLAAGNRSGSVVAQNGTSVAVPQVVRWIADTLSEMPANKRATFDANKELLAAFGSHKQQPPRPTQTRTEMQTEPEIRFERLQGGFLSTHGSTAIDRGVLSKLQA